MARPVDDWELDALEAGQLGAWEVDLRSDQVRLGEPTRALFGVDPDGESALSTARFLAHVHPEDRDRVLARYRQTRDSDEVFEDQFRVFSEDGAVRWLAARGRFAHKGGEGQCRIRGVSWDITTSKRRELAALDAEDQLRRMMIDAPALISTTHGPDHVIAYVNRTLATRFSDRELVGRPAREALPELAEQGLIDDLDRVYGTGDAVDREELETHLTGPCDEPWHGYFCCLLRPWYEPGEVIGGVVTFLIDVTREVKLRRSIGQSEAMFRQLAESVPDIVWRGDQEGAWDFVNERWTELTGRPTSEALGWSWLRFVHPDDAEAVRAGCSALRRGEAENFMFRLQAADGGYRWLINHSTPVAAEGEGVRRWFGSSTDITELKESEAALRDADRNKDAFLAMLGHELRNPLAAIRSAGQLLKLRSPRDPKLHHAQQAIERQSMRMGRLIDGLLDVSRITRGKLHLELGPVLVREVIDQVLDTHQDRARDQGLNVVVHLPAEDLWVEGDALRLAQVLDNLLSNALKYTDAPGTITVTLAREDDQVLLSVKDTGVGVEPAVLERIFEPFEQAPADVGRSRGGLGLGLALCRGLVELQGGHIEARSEGRGRGTEVLVALPLLRRESAHLPSSVPDDDAVRVLVVEDDEDAGQLLRDVLEVLGCRVEVVTRGEDALPLARRWRPSLVLCDLGLPGMSGYDVARTMKEDPQLRQARLIALSGYGQPEDRKRTAEAGFAEHLTKPVDLPELEGTLAKVRCSGGGARLNGPRPEA